MKNYKFKINGNDYSVDIVNIEENKAQVEVNGKSFEVEMDMTGIKVPVAPKAAPVAAPAVAGWLASAKRCRVDATYRLPHPAPYKLW